MRRNTLALPGTGAVTQARLDAISAQLNPRISCSRSTSIAEMVHVDAQSAPTRCWWRYPSATYAALDRSRRQWVSHGTTGAWTQQYLVIEKVRLGDRMQAWHVAECLDELGPAAICSPWSRTRWWHYDRQGACGPAPWIGAGQSGGDVGWMSKRRWRGCHRGHRRPQDQPRPIRAQSAFLWRRRVARGTHQPFRRDAGIPAAAADRTPQRCRRSPPASPALGSCSSYDCPPRGDRRRRAVGIGCAAAACWAGIAGVTVVSECASGIR